MKQYISLFVGILSIIASYGQKSTGDSGTTKHLKDEFKYKKLKIKDKETGNISFAGGKSSGTGKSLILSNKSMSSGGAPSEITETEGNLSVSLTGGAIYNIPIAVPAGINGVNPEISLSYNSQGGNGLAGYGWNISGISTISRIPSTKYHDGQIDGVDFDNLDRFALDGERLVLKSGTYGGDGAVYETETYSNLKIVSHGVSSFGSNYGPSYFTVYYPDGSLAYYGNSSDSRSRINYSITYWQNPQGARISYEYYTGTNYSAQSISKIKYGSLNATPPINEIRFAYKYYNTGLERFEQSFINGASFIRNNILDYIEVYSNNVRYRRYNLAYNSTNLKYKRLQIVTEVSGDGTLSHSPITFNYSNSTSSVNYNGITTNLGLINIEQRNAETVSLDLTGNGKMDFLVYPKNDKTKFWLFKDIQSGSYNYPYEANTGAFETIFPTTWLNYQNKVLAGQGLTVVQKGSVGQVNFKVYSNGTVNPIYYQYTKTWSAPTYSYDNSTTSTVQKDILKEYISGDFNGDGLTDVLAIGKPYTSRSCYEYPCNDPNDPYAKSTKTKGNTTIQRVAPIDGSVCTRCSAYTNNYKTVYFIDLRQDVSTGFVNNAGYLQQSIATGDKLLPGDFNGDGKTDILHITNGKYFIYSLNNNNALTLLWQATDSAINTTDPILLGDYNGDGKTDFMKPATNYTNFATDHSWFDTYLSTGISFLKGLKQKPFKYEITNWNGNNGVLTGHNLIPLDFNGDGRTDIIEYTTTTYNSSSNGTQVIKIHNNLGLDDANNNKETNIEFAYGGTASKTGNLEHFPIPIFLSSNQPNKNLDFASISNSWVTNFSFTQDHREDVLLRSITNNGVTQSIEYNNLDPSVYNSDYTQVYQTSYDESYPNIDVHVAPSTKVVTMLQRISSGTTALKQVFSYYGAVYNAEGLGFLGFKGIARSNWSTGSSDRIFNISKHDPLLRGIMTDEYQMSNYFTFTVPSSGYISKTTYQNSSSLSGTKVLKAWVTSILTQNALEGTNTNKTYVYDGYNNPTKITTSFLGYGSHVTDIVYGNSTGATYYIGRPTSKVETNTIGGETFSTETQLSYTGYLLTQKKTKGNNTPFDTETYDYDAFGNIIKTTTTPYNTAPRIIQFEYDSSGRFLTKQTNVEGLETLYQHNTNTGTLSKVTNPFGQETNYQYDSWNRLMKVTDYLGNDVTTSYVESSNNFYTVTNTGDDGSGAITVYDALKRVTTVKQKDVLGQWISTSYLYDKFDRIWKESEPYTGSSATQWNEIEYDFYGRPIKLTEYTGKVTNITYSGLTVTVNDGTKTVTTTKDAMGNVTSVTDPGGTINYTYFGNGNLKTSNYNGVVVSTEQDGWGRKTKLTDPSAGIFTYAYNGFGEITNETTPKGATTYTYSSIGKLLQKNITGDNTSMNMQYAYNSTNKLLSSISQTSSDGNNGSYTYTYDSNQRLQKSSEINTFAKFTKTYTYDAFGRVDTEEDYAQLLMNSKSSTKKIKNTYQYGALKTVKDFVTNEILSNISGINARGQVTSITMGNDMREQKTYDSYGYLTESSVEMKASTVAIEVMKLTNSFNVQRGTLTSRTNSMFSWSENFTYDSLDRLVNFNDNNGNNNQTYDLLGRIMSNNDVGDYTYTGKSYKLDNVDLNNQGDLFYQQNTLQQVTYNAFKKPFEISEEGKEKIGFQYNAFMGRSSMFYGDTNSNILQRKNRKHYSYDGSMEISYDSSLGKTTFVTYIGGDAYNAPAIWRSEQSISGTSEEYYYLHRDYLGSILMISNKYGKAKEKRQFDAWGNIVKLTDGRGVALDKFVYLDRGYTGHEHLQGVNLIHMNGRLYDPKLKRFLAADNNIQDPFNTQNFNRYSYVLNNPLMYVDPSGETAEYPGVEEPYYSPGQQNANARALKSLFESINWHSVGEWFSKQYHSIKKLRIGHWISGWFKKRNRKSAPIEYGNYEGLTSDPLAGSSANTPASYFGGGGTDTGGLGIVGKYYSSLWNSFTNQIRNAGNSISEFFSDPLGRIGTAASNHWDTITNPMNFINSMDENFAQYNPLHQTIRNAAISFYSDDFVETFGQLGGENLADKSIEVAGLAAGEIGWKIITSGIRNLGIKFINVTANGSRVKGIDKAIMYIRRTNSKTNFGETYTRSIKYWSRTGGKTKSGGWKHWFDW